MIRFSGLSLMRGTKPLFDLADATINPGEKVGLVGPNGAGKTSLFSLLMKELHPDGGDIDFPAGWRISHVAQETPALQRRALDYAIDGDTPPQAGSRTGATGIGTARRRIRHTYRRAAHGTGRCGCLYGQITCRTTALGSRFLHGRNATRGGDIFRRLAHAAESGAGPDVSFRSAASGRTDQPSRSGCHFMAGRLAQTLYWNPDRHFARPRLSRWDRQCHPPHRRWQTETLCRQLFRIRTPASRTDDAHARHDRKNRPNAAPIWNRISTVSVTRPPRPGRRKAVSRRWKKWKHLPGSGRRPNSPSTFSNPNRLPIPFSSWTASRPVIHNATPRVRRFRPRPSSRISNSPFKPVNASVFWASTERANPHSSGLWPESCRFCPDC